MRITLVFESTKPHQIRALGALAQGMRRHGLSVDVSDSFTRADVAVVWGAKYAPTAYERVIRLEAGYINGRSGEYVRDRLQSISVSWDWLHGRSIQPPPGCPPDRWQRLGLELKPWVDRAGTLICLNHPGDAMATSRKWWTDYEGTIRKHPLIDPDQPPLSEALESVGRCVTWNSGAGIQAVIDGVPTIALDEGSMVYGMNADCLFDLCDALKTDPDAARQRWANQLAYRQWSHAELSSGEAWEFARYGLETNQHDDEADRHANRSGGPAGSFNA